MSKTSSNRKMTREGFLYHVKYVNWHPLLTLKSKRHTVIIRVMKDDKGEYYGRKPLHYDIIIDGVTGPDFKTIKELLEYMRGDPLLKYFYSKARVELRWLDGYI